VIAAVTGTSHGTVGAIRQRATGEVDRLHRIGRDGRSHPVDTADARRRAGELLARSPSASLRQIGSAAGLSPGTVRDVRDRIRRGEDPVPDRRRPGAPAAAAGPAAQAPPVRPEAAVDAGALLRNLRKDPSLLYSQTGRLLLRMLEAYPVVTARSESLARAVPPHCAVTVAEIARQFAQVWDHFADHIEHAGRADD
jgi:hypothetical protein